MLWISKRKLGTILMGLCVLAMIMTVNKYFSGGGSGSDNGISDDNTSLHSKTKSAYNYPIDDTGQVQGGQHQEQHLSDGASQHQEYGRGKNFKAWQVDEADVNTQSNLHQDDFHKNVIHAPANIDNMNNEKDGEVVIKNFNDPNFPSHGDGEYSNNAMLLHDTTTTLTDQGYVAIRKKDLSLGNNKRGGMAGAQPPPSGQQSNNLPAIKDVADVDIPVFSPDGQRYIPRHRVVHLDLKGAPPKMSYLKSLLPLLKEAGATALLVEYEDMFPYWGRLKNISARNAYTVSEIKNFRRWAAEHGKSKNMESMVIACIL